MLLTTFLIAFFISWIQLDPTLTCAVLLFIALLCVFLTVRRLLPLCRSLKPVFFTTNDANENDNEKSIGGNDSLVDKDSAVNKIV